MTLFRRSLIRLIAMFITLILTGVVVFSILTAESDRPVIGEFYSPKNQDEIFTITVASPKRTVISYELGGKNGVKKTNWDIIRAVVSNYNDNFTRLCITVKFEGDVQQFGVEVMIRDGFDLEHNPELRDAKKYSLYEPDKDVNYDPVSGICTYDLEITNDPPDRILTTGIKAIHLFLDPDPDVDVSERSERSMTILDIGFRKEGERAYPPPDAESFSVSLDPDKIIFEDEMVGYDEQEVKTVTVENDGYFATGNLNIKLLGANKDDFIISKELLSSLDIGETGQFEVSPKLDLADGEYTAIVEVSNANITEKANLSFTVGSPPPTSPSPPPPLTSPSPPKSPSPPPKSPSPPPSSQPPPSTPPPSSTPPPTPTSTTKTDDENTDEEEIDDEGIPKAPIERKPLGFAANIGTKFGVHLTWKQSDPNDKYWIYRSTVKGEYGVSLTRSPIRSDAFFDPNVKPNTTYYYTIFYDGDGPENGETIEIRTSSLATKEMEGVKNFILMKIGKETMLVNGKTVDIDPGRGTTPVIINSRTLVPIRAIVENMGGKVRWDATNKKVTLNVFNNSITMWLEKTEILVNGVSTEIDVAPQTINDRTMLPIRFVAENVGCIVGWIEHTQEVVIVFPRR